MSLLKRIASCCMAIYTCLLLLGLIQGSSIMDPGGYTLWWKSFTDRFLLLEHATAWRLSAGLFLTVLGAINYKAMGNMFRYWATRETVTSYALLISYSIVVLGLMRIMPIPQAYQHIIYPTLVMIIIFFPSLFPNKPIKNPTRWKDSPNTFQLMGKGGERLPINAPELGILIAGAPGSGKTKYLIEPMLYRMIEKGYAGVLYDYDFSAQGTGKEYSLTQLAYHCCKNYTGGKTRWVSINFQDLATSARINSIAPAYIHDRKKLGNVLRTFLLNMNPQLSQKEDFWYKNTYALLKSLVVFLANQYPQYCTLPHVIMMGLQPQKSLLELLKTDQEASLYASPIWDALENAREQLAGVMANFKVALERLIDKDLFWVLSGDEVPHVVNDPENPLVVCLGNTPTEKEVLSPVLAMVIALLVSNMYGHQRNKSFLLIDELPTLFLPSLKEVPATARKYGIATIIALQNMAQLEETYGVVGARELKETFSNHMVGRSQFQLAKEVSEMFGKKEAQAASRTTAASRLVSETIHQKEEAIISPQEMMNLKVGEFAGKLAQSGKGFFRMELQPIGRYDRKLSYQSLCKLPSTKLDTASNFWQIQEEVERLVAQSA